VRVGLDQQRITLAGWILEAKKLAFMKMRIRVGLGWSYLEIALIVKNLEEWGL
jgi:hypothetical protein